MAAAVIGALASQFGSMALKKGAEYGAQAVGNYVGAKTGQAVGEMGENASNQQRQDARSMNVDGDAYANRSNAQTERGNVAENNRQQQNAILGNQLNRSAERSQLTNQMTLNDQAIASNQAVDLANAYQNAQARQVESGRNLMNMIGGTRAAVGSANYR